MTEDTILLRVKDIVAGVAGPLRSPEEGGPDTPLGEAGYWLDSMDLLEVILACERDFGISFDAGEDLTAEALSTVRSLAELIRSRAST